MTGRKIILTLLLLFFPLVFFLFSLPLKTSAALPGDANNDGIVDGVDYVFWLNNYNKIVNDGSSSGDFDGNGKVDGADYVIWLNNYGSSGSVNATPTKTPTPVNPSNPPVTPIQGSGIWISKEEIAKLPITGQAGCAQGSFCADAWNGIISKADSSWGTPDLTDYAGLGHSQAVWTGALAAARLSLESNRQADAQKYYDKTINALNDILGTEAPALPSSGGGKDDGSLALARQFPRYVIAADLLGITNWAPNYKGYKNFVDYILRTKFTFRVGDGGHSLAEGGGKCASNGCAMSQSARIAGAAYLKDQTQLNDAWLTFRRYSGDYTSSVTIEFSSAGDAWYHNNSNKLAINPKGATCAGSTYPADGVIPNDQGRGGNCPSNPNTTPGYTQYPWEGLQGAYGAAYMLYRLGYNLNGKNPFQINDQALLRAVQYQWYLQQKFGGSWYDSGRAAWVKHLAWYFYGYKPVSYDPSDAGRNIGFTQWTHQK